MKTNHGRQRFDEDEDCHLNQMSHLEGDNRRWVIVVVYDGNKQTRRRMNTFISFLFPSLFLSVLVFCTPFLSSYPTPKGNGSKYIHTSGMIVGVDGVLLCDEILILNRHM